MDKPEFRIERGPAATDEAFAIGMAKLLEREGRTIAAAELRRLHELLEAEQVLLQRVIYPELQRLRAQRDALVEAGKRVKETRVFLGAVAQEMLDAAIAAVEGEKT